MASKLTSMDISEITRQADVLSKPLRDNFANVKNKINEVIDDLAAVSIGTTNAETTAARPYHASLKERLDSIEWGKSRNIDGRYNYIKDGGVVSINANVAKVDVEAGEAKINGIDVKWSATTSAAVAACASGKHRIDVVCAQSDGTITIVTGTVYDDATEDPIFPIISTSRLSLAALYVDDTVSVDLTNNIYQLKNDNHFLNYYCKIARTLYQGRYNFNNLIFDAAVELDCTSVSSPYGANKKSIIINCTGNYHATANAVFTVASPHDLPRGEGFGGDGGQGNGTLGIGGTGGELGEPGLIIITEGVKINTGSFSGGKGGNGGEAQGDGATKSSGGGGGGGGASLISSGGAGGGGGTAGAAVGSLTSGAGTNTGCPPMLIIKAYNIKIYGLITMDGEDGGDGTGGGTIGGEGGAGGSSGGNLLLFAADDIYIDAAISLDGGDGGDGGGGGAHNNGGGGGGGGGAGGYCLIRSLTYSNTSSISVDQGLAGAGGGGTGSGTAGGAGNDGTIGVVDQATYGDIGAAFADIHVPINFGIELL